MAIPPRPQAFDDGCIAIDALRAWGAERQYQNRHEAASAAVAVPASLQGHVQFVPLLAFEAEADPASGLGGHAGRETAAHSLPDVTGEQEEDDPFGYGGLGFDDQEAIVSLGSTSDIAPQGATDVQGCMTAPPRKQAHCSHVLRRTGHIVWCAVCGRHAAARLGAGLLNPCRGTATGAYTSRLNRRKAGRHPASGGRV